MAILRQAKNGVSVSKSHQEHGMSSATWSMDFMYGKLPDGRKFRLLSILDDFNQEGLEIEIDFFLPTPRLIRTL
jgi:putative transposase